MEIKDKTIKTYLETVINKKIEEIEENDLEEIKVIGYTGEMNDEDNYRINLSDLYLFKNIEEINISNALITLEDIALIMNNNIKRVNFRKCTMDDDNSLKILTNIEELSLDNCYNNDYSFLTYMNNLKKLAIISPYAEKAISLSNISNLRKLKELILKTCKISDFKELINCNNLVLLNILDSEIQNDDIEIINNLKEIKTLYIDEIYNRYIVNNNIKIYNNLYHLMLDNIDDNEFENIQKQASVK